MLPTTRPRSRSSRRAVGVAFALVLLVLTGVVTGCESTAIERRQVLDLVNQSRLANGVRPVVADSTLDLKADAWAKRLRDRCSLSHSRLSDGAPRNWYVLGENVGYGPGIDLVHQGYLNSPDHLRNIMDPRFTRMGAAAVWGTCNGQRTVFTVQVFMQTLQDAGA